MSKNGKIERDTARIGYLPPLVLSRLPRRPETVAGPLTNNYYGSFSICSEMFQENGAAS